MTNQGSERNAPVRDHGSGKAAEARAGTARGLRSGRVSREEKDGMQAGVR